MQQPKLKAQFSTVVAKKGLKQLLGIYTLAGVIKVNAFLPASEKEQMKAVKLGTDEATT